MQQQKTTPFPLNSRNIATDTDLNMHYVSAIVTRNYSRFRQYHTSATCYGSLVIAFC